MNRINANKRRVLRQLLNNKREDAGQTSFKSVRGYNKLYGTTTNETFRIMDDLLGVVVRNVDEENNMNLVRDLYRSVRGTTRHFLYIVGDKVIVDRVVDIPDNEEFKNWFDNGESWYYMVNSDTSKFEYHEYQGKIYSYPLGENITPQRIIQSYLDGKTNCVFTPIRNWFETELAKDDIVPSRLKKLKGKLKPLSKFEEQYKDGVPEDKMEEVAKKLNVKLYVRSLFSNNSICYGDELKDQLKVFHYTNTRADHVDMGTLVSNQKPEQVSKDFLMDFIDECDKNKTFYYYTKSDGINAVYTIDKAYSLKSEFNEATSELQKKYNMDYMKIDDFKYPDLSLFVKRGTHFNTSIKFNNQYNLKNIDQKKAYANFHDCKYYEGFLGKITDFRKTDKIEGVGMYLIKDLRPFNCYLKDRANFVKLNEKMNMYKSNNVYTSAELKFLKDMGWRYTITAGCWGLDSFDFEFGEDMLTGKYGAKPFVNADGELKMKGASFYAMAVGSWCSHQHYQYKFIRGDERTYHMLCESDCGEVLKFDGDAEISIRTRKETCNTLSHISAFILAYQRLALIEQLQEMDINKLDSVYVDGIYYQEHDFKIIDTFKEGDCESYSSMNFNQNNFITEIYENKPNVSYGHKRNHNSTELWTGAGGCGKTHLNLTDDGFINMMFASPSHKLNAVKANEYGANVITHQALVSTNPMCKALYANVLIIDEVSMMSNEDKEHIMDKFKKIKIIMCGDVGYQLPCIKGTPFKNEGFVYYNHLTTNHRIKNKDDPLHELLNELRDCIKNNTSYNLNIPLIDEKYLIENYKREDMILTFTNKSKNKYTQLFSQLKKWYIEESQVHNHGEIFIQDTRPEGKKVEIRHGFTTHSIQGETATDNLYIDIECMNDPRLFYTAVSRAKSIKQVKLLKPKSQQDIMKEKLKEENMQLEKENKFKCRCCKKVYEIDNEKHAKDECFDCIWR
jgi:hypothetical protein